MEETAEISFHNLLKKYNFSEEDASKFVALQKQMQSESLASKVDVSDLKTALKADIADLKSSTDISIADLKNSTDVNIANVKSALTWRMFLFWLTQIGVFLAFAYRIFPGV